MAPSQGVCIFRLSSCDSEKELMANHQISGPGLIPAMNHRIRQSLSTGASLGIEPVETHVSSEAILNLFALCCVSIHAAADLMADGGRDSIAANGRQDTTRWFPVSGASAPPSDQCAGVQP